MIYNHHVRRTVRLKQDTEDFPLRVSADANHNNPLLPKSPKNTNPNTNILPHHHLHLRAVPLFVKKLLPLLQLIAN